MRLREFGVLLSALFVFFFISESAGAVDVYTFKKERVDQGMDGNRGYIMGAVPKADSLGSRKRTLVGVDIELPIVSSDEGTDNSAGVESSVKSDIAPVAQTVVSSSDGKDTEVIDVSESGEETSGEIEFKDEIEDEWIK